MPVSGLVTNRWYVQDAKTGKVLAHGDMNETEVSQIEASKGHIVDRIFRTSDDKFIDLDGILMIGEVVNSVNSWFTVHMKLAPAIDIVSRKLQGLGGEEDAAAKRDELLTAWKAWVGQNK